MRIRDFPHLLRERHYACASQHVPWLSFMVHAMDKGWWYPIGGRQDPDQLYLARFWCHEPKPHPNPQSPCTWESQNSTLLHWFARGDDDGALHDHPWSFTTHILSGGYTETVPTDLYLRHERPLGPTEEYTKQVYRGTGSTVVKRAEDLHAVTNPEINTVTLVHTGARYREWGFKPPGRRWVHHREYLAEKYKAAS